MRRFSLVLLPFLAGFALVFGLFYISRAYTLLQQSHIVPAALSFVFGCAGAGLAVAIWVARKRVRRVDGPPNAPSSGPAA